MPRNRLCQVLSHHQTQTEQLLVHTYHFFVVLLINADHRLLDYNMSDFRKVRKIVPLFPDLVFLLILLVFIFQFFPFQFIFFLFNRNNLTTCRKGTRAELASSFSTGKRSVLGNHCRAYIQRGEDQHAWIHRRGGTVGLGSQVWVLSRNTGVLSLEETMRT